MDRIPQTHVMAGEAAAAAMSALSIGHDIPPLSDEQNPRSPYVKQPLRLGEIRLLTIDAITMANDSPPKSEETRAEPAQVTLRLTTTRASLAEKPDFDAVSYVWGTAPASVIIQCNDAPLRITPTAYEMLQHLRLYRPNLNRPLWIDAICINQQDLEEKSHQVQQMSKVYSNATTVITWLGLLNSYIWVFMEDFPRVMDLARAWIPTYVTDDPMWRGADWPGRDDDFWVGLYYLLDNDWFRRLWTYQEFILAQNAIFICGSVCIDAIAFSVFVSDGMYVLNGYLPFGTNIAARVATKPTSSSLAFSACNSLDWARKYLSEQDSGFTTFSLPDLLYSLRFLGVKEPVDKVWAILGLMDESLQDILAPMVDYSDKGRNEYWTTYIKFAKTLIEVEQSCSVLNMPPRLASTEQRLPSWCVDLSGAFACQSIMAGDWNQPVEVLHVGQALRSSDDDLQKSVARQLEILDHSLKYTSVMEPSNILRTRGFLLDTVSEVVEDVTLVALDARINISHWNDWTLENPAHVARMDVLRRALNLARRATLGDGDSLIIPSEYLMCLWADCRIAENAERAYNDAWIILNPGGRQHYDSLELLRKNEADYILRQMSGFAGHSFFATENGRFGIAHPGCRPGDTVCTFYGGEPLYILRWPKVGRPSVRTGSCEAGT
ncbi:heterokaryon incompatibility protein-domain-containing protein [Paraphoma chrysanthemicola]|uniref:Heterokaryon incompatibility protein-domain-containing protein n=1 Tax=Paraphoma chrysanthemicola TaxID=798071 RepID=A0A8K0QTH7_9PLEO|nr:heterokaryon incompatibility protein-domain-containing protein [Paraphoma chrysanthemicola]